MRKRIILLAALMIGAMALVSCAESPDPVTQEASVGVNLEKKAKDVTGQAIDDEQEANDMMDTIDNLDSGEE